MNPKLDVQAPTGAVCPRRFDPVGAQSRWDPIVFTALQVILLKCLQPHLLLAY